MSLSRQAIQKIQKIVGKEHISCAKEDLLCYSYDSAGGEYFPDVVVFPTTAQEISDILKLANQFQFSVTPRGSGSGMTGGSVPVTGGVVLVMTRMNKISKIDRDNLIGVVEPGVITGVFQKAVEKEGMFYPPDPSSSDFSTLGGNVAECAGGPKAVKYGVTRDYVLGLQVVLATGEIVRTGVQTAKGVVGYDLTRLIVGSEGTLGVVTEITLRLLPRPESVRTLTAVYDRMAAAAQTVSEIIRRGIIPRVIEFMDNASIRCAEEYAHSGLPVEADALLIIEMDGTVEETEKAARRGASLCRDLGAGRVETADTQEEIDALWKARKSVSPALFKYGPDKINEDIVVPRSRIPAMVEKIKALSRDTGLTMVSFGHAGDGNIHFNIMLDKKNPHQLQKATQAVEELFDFTLELGGTISGEHGIGISKAPYLDKEISPDSLALMKRIKKAFDPSGILNPGKMRM
jgi:glycolate oxidase